MKKGLAVGITEYPFGNLDGCVEDAEKFAEVMRWNGDPKDGDNNFQMTVSPNLGRAALRRAIKDLFAKDDEMVLFYFSGHGELSETGGYLLTSDSVDDDPGIPMSEILTLANRSKAKDRVIILDCCHSGAFGDADDYNYDPSPTKIQQGVSILTASSKNQVAFQIDDAGAFTTFLIDALNGSAADLEGHVTPGSIYTYIDKMLGIADDQRPVFKTNVSRFTVLRKATPVIERSVLRKLTTYFPEADSKKKLNPSYEFTNTPGAKDSKEPYADKENVAIFKELQKLQGIGLVVPQDAEFMYFAAMKSKSCKLTPLGQQYSALIKRKET